ncbi:CFEM domain [Geosmithia morbida]|uniref:CFEM domain n=1 Tax=Geosmithia morbida TaxID=1094350 RepID=A0A9P5D792_9HYPO|nr:CFEM domain [Geosmithia morbida]KAF4124294.1 CFEM domain [Geosmithia morbida]
MKCITTLILFTLAASTTTTATTAAAAAAAAAAEDDANSTISELKSQLPKCPVACIPAGAQKVGCESTDHSCLCRNIQDMTDAVAPCLVDSGCSLDEMAETGSVTLEICKAAAAVGGENSTTIDFDENSETTSADTAQPIDGVASSIMSSGGRVMAVAAVVAGILKP